jgi:hypothetical protein
MALEIQVLALDRHKRGRVKPVNGISTFLSLEIGSQKAIQMSKQ